MGSGRFTHTRLRDAVSDNTKALKLPNLGRKAWTGGDDGIKAKNSALARETYEGFVKRLSKTNPGVVLDKGTVDDALRLAASRVPGRSVQANHTKRMVDRVRARTSIAANSA